MTELALDEGGRDKGNITIHGYPPCPRIDHSNVSYIRSVLPRL
jgi:hypothetical protein